MAAAETARLIASLELQDKNFTRGIRNVERGVGRVDKKLSAFGGFVNRNLARGVDRFAASLVDGVFAGVESLKELEQQQAQTNAVIKSTGAVAGVSGEEVTKLAEKYEGLNAIIGDEIIRSGENMLLTFTNIHKDAFEPTLEAVLDMNTALGKGPEGLTSTAMQVGKALNDPTKGLTKLQRAGVNFTKGQIKQIKALQKSGDLLGAQKIILAELNREFGGSFAAQGDTTAGKVAKFNDAVEDLQRTFAKALLPIISKVADKLGTFLGDPAVIAAIEDAGETLGTVFDEILTSAERIPWSEIGQGLSIAATGAKGILDAFLSMPGWVKAFIIGGFVANKVTGGFIGDIFKSVLGIRAGVVNVSGPIAGGGVPAGGAAAGGAGKLMNAVRVLGAVTIAGASIYALAETFKGFQTTVTESQQDLLEKVNQTSEQGFEETIANINATNEGIRKMNPLENVLAGIFGGSEIVKNYEMAADRIVKQLQSGELDRDEITTAIGALQSVLETNPEVELPGVESAIERLIKAYNKGPIQGPPKPETKPRVSGVGDRPSPGNPRVFQKNLDKIGFDKWVTKAEDIKTAVTKTSADQKAELANVKNATATGFTDQKAAIAAAKAKATADAARNKAAIDAARGAVRTGTAATTARVGTVSPPVVSTLYSVGSQIVSAVWGSGAANRPVIQSTNVVNNYNRSQRTGATTGSRYTGTARHG